MSKSPTIIRLDDSVGEWQGFSDAKKFLEKIGAPTPHYLTGSFKVSADNLSFVGTALFPSSDQSVGSRIRPVPHVNQAHHALAAWNIAAILAYLNGLVNGVMALDSETSLPTLKVRTPVVTLPDVPCLVHAQVLHVGSNAPREFEGATWDTRKGRYAATFYQKRDGVAEDTTTALETPFVGFGLRQSA